MSASLLSLEQAAAAAYVEDQVLTTGERLVQGQVDHTLLPGRRVEATEEDLATMRAQAAALGLLGDGADGADDDDDALKWLSLCPMCARRVSHGDFGVDHIAYYVYGDADKAVAKVRSIPRIWCTPCAKQRVKQLKKPYAQSRVLARWLDEWADFAKNVGGDPLGRQAVQEEEVPPPCDKASKKVREWVVHAVAGAPRALTEGKVRFIVTSAKVLSGDVTAVDAPKEEDTAVLTLRVHYAAQTALLSGEAIQAAGSTVFTLDVNGKNLAAVRVLESGSCRLQGPAPPVDLQEQIFRKSDLVHKLWLRKCAPTLVTKPLMDHFDENVAKILAKLHPTKGG